MHLKFVEIFCDVVLHRSFSKAAAAHEVSQSTASQAVLFLEKRLGTLLIDRSQRPFELTPEGRVYYDGCRDLLDTFNRLEDRVLQMRDKVVGTVHVAAIYSVGLLQMDSYVKLFNERYPDSKVRVEYLHPEEVYRQVLADEADLGLVSFPRDRGELSSHPWQDQLMVLVVPPTHRLAQQTSVPVQALNGEDFVGFTTELTIRKEMDRWFRKSRVTVNIVHEFDNIENIKRATEVGNGVAVLPLPTVQREVEGGSLVAIRLEDAEWLRPLGIVHRKHKSLSNAAQKFLHILQDQCPTGIRAKSRGAPAEAKEMGSDEKRTKPHESDSGSPEGAALVKEPGRRKQKERETHLI
ncbi:MAG: LysR family transcriptional regulator [Planctomycetales bacterium]